MKFDNFDKNKPIRKFFCGFISAIILGSLFFTILPSISQYYYHNFDKTVYWSWNNIVLDKKDYKPCDTIIAIGELNSKITIQSTNITQITNIRTVNNLKLEIPIYFFEENNKYIKEGINPQYLQAFKLPCDNKLSSGVYYLEGIISFKIKDEDKNYVWQTPSFTIIESKETPS
jgi:hypothetical protein